MGSSSSTHVRSLDSNSKCNGNSTKRRKSTTADDFQYKVTKDPVQPLSIGKESGRDSVHECDESVIKKEVSTVPYGDNDLKLPEVQQKQFAELERQNLELQDYIENLESQLEAIDRENASKRPIGDCSETLKVKEQDILKLEKENETIKAEMNKLRLRCKKKIRQLNTKLAEQKNEGSVQALELREEISTLKDENVKLKDQLKCNSVGSEQHSATETHHNGGQSHTSVILELSSRVSEQDARIIQLENTLHEKNKELERVQVLLKADPLTGRHSMENGTQHARITMTSNDTMSKRECQLNTHINLDGTSDWNEDKAFEQRVRPHVSNATTPKSSSRSYPGRDSNRREDTDSTRSELQAIAEEMKKLRKRGGKSKRNSAIARSPVQRDGPNQGELSGRDSGLSVDSQNQSTISASAPNIRCNRTGSGVSHTSSVFSNDSPEGDNVRNKHVLGVAAVRDRPPSGGIRYDADISHCDTDMGLSDNSDNGQGLEYEESETSTVTPVDRSSIRQISAPRSKKRKGLLKSLVRKDSVELNNSTLDGTITEQLHPKPPVYKVRPKDLEVQDADMLLNSIDQDLLMHSKPRSNIFGLTSVS